MFSNVGVCAGQKLFHKLHVSEPYIHEAPNSLHFFIHPLLALPIKLESQVKPGCEHAMISGVSEISMVSMGRNEQRAPSADLWHLVR